MTSCSEDKPLCKRHSACVQEKISCTLFNSQLKQLKYAPSQLKLNRINQLSFFPHLYSLIKVLEQAAEGSGGITIPEELKKCVDLVVHKNNNDGEKAVIDM